MKMTEISKKGQEKRLKWYGHAMRRDDEHINRRVLEMKIEGVRARGEKTLVRLRCQKHEEELGEY